MVLPVIRGNKLDGFIFGMKKCLGMFMNDGDEERLNPAFEDWTTIDQLLLGWLYNNMTVEVASHSITGYRMSHVSRVVVCCQGPCWSKYKVSCHNIQKLATKIEKGDPEDGGVPQ